MREAILTLPQVNNFGYSLEHVKAQTVRKLAEKFGGATVTSAEGVWIDGGKVYNEPVWRMIVAMAASKANNAALRKIALEAGHDALQLAMYIKYASGKVDILDTKGTK